MISCHEKILGFKYASQPQLEALNDPIIIHLVISLRRHFWKFCFIGKHKCLNQWQPNLGIFFQRCMARGGHAMPYHAIPCHPLLLYAQWAATPEMALWLLQGWSTAGWAASECLLPPWTTHAVRVWYFDVWSL